MKEMKVFTQEVEDGLYSLSAVIVCTEAGLNIYLGGGEAPHIGTVVISQPRLSLTGDGSISCTTSVYNFLAHKDDGVAIPLAEKLCKELNKIIVVTAGVHLDNAKDADITRFRNNLEIIASRILETINTQTC